MAVDQSDLQGNVLCGYTFPVASFSFARITGEEAGRALFEQLGPRLQTARSWGTDAPPFALNLALSFDGLRALGAADALLERFPEEFRAGMAARADLLGDTGSAAPGRWDQRMPAGSWNLLLTANAAGPDELGTAERVVDEALAPCGAGAALVHRTGAAVIARTGEPLAREHFGFADGFSQPAIDDPVAGPYEKPGQGTPVDEGEWKALAPGEFVLGYTDEDDVIAGDGIGPIARNGSFTVLRKLHQDVAGFRAFLSDHAGPEGEAWLGARLMGRWPDGTPVSIAPDGPRPELTKDQRGTALNDFRYSEDGDGRVCPLGAHIRRANPRDSLGWGGALSLRHRIIRRGIPYGPVLPVGAADDGADRGLMFVCHQASIARQFEVVQGSWLVDGDAFGLGGDPDPVMGSDPIDGRPAKMTIQGDRPRFLGPLQRFVVTRGGEYLFTPGLSAVLALGRGL